MQNIVSLKNETIIIDFKTLFKRELSQYSEFKINKRAYHKKLPLMVPAIKLFIEEKECLDYAYSLLDFKYLINTKYQGAIIDLDTVREFIQTKIFSDELLIANITEEVENNYDLNLDLSISDKNENLQITDSINKSYLKAAMLMRLLLPIVSALSDNLANAETLDIYLYEIYTDCMVFMNGGDKIILQKIYNIVSSRITQTRYSDKDIWKFLESQNKDILITLRTFNNYIVVNCFIKVMNNKSIISYIDVILKNKIGYLFRLNYKVSHKALDYYSVTNNSDGNSLSEIDKLEQTLLRKDKGLSFINEQSIIKEVNWLKSKYDGIEDFEMFKESIIINKFTKDFLSIYYKKKFDIIPRDEYMAYLIYDMLDVLRRKGFILIPEIIICEESGVRAHNKRMIKEKLSDSVKYKLLLNKYKDVSNLVSMDKNFINEIIFSIKQRRFIDPITHEDIELDIELLNEEVLDFYFMQ